MAANRRRRIPTTIEEEVLFRADHTCCICRIKGKDVQIHRIDGNPSNNKAGNLAVVCLDCHSRITGTRGLGKSYRPGEVRRYKRAWDQQVLASRRIHRPTIRYKKELISQIDIIICEVLACRRNNPQIEKLLEVLFQIHLWRGSHEIDGKIIEGLHHLALMSGLSSPRLATLVSKKLWEMCFHFVGPEDVGMDKRDLAQVLECIDALGTLAQFNCEFGHGRKAIHSIAEHAENFFEVGLWYSKKRIANAVMRAYREALKGCYSDGQLGFAHGRTILRRSVRKLQKLLEEEQSAWAYQHRRLRELLSL